MYENAIIVFAKNPVLGKAKTRIAKDVGDQKAFEIYKNLLSITEDILNEIPIDKYLFFTDFIDEKLWALNNLNYRLQSKGGLGKKMADAFINVFHSGHKKALIIGSDCPYITKELLMDAFEQLESTDHILGPTIDGGFYLYGTNKFHSFIFDGIIWSSETVLENVLNNIQNIGEKYTLLPTLSDIDHIEDWEDFLSSKN